jgi:hypothetical protein
METNAGVPLWSDAYDAANWESDDYCPWCEELYLLHRGYQCGDVDEWMAEMAEPVLFGDRWYWEDGEEVRW